MLYNFYKILMAAVIVSFLSIAYSSDHGASIPNLVGEWKGMNSTVSDAKGYTEWEKVVVIDEQQDRRFKGHFSYSEGNVKFFGVIFPDNVSFAWVSEKSYGYNMGRILGANKIAACYVEAGKQATAGCSELTRDPNP